MSEHDEWVGEGASARERIEWLERELARERAQARHTSRLVFFATNYAESIRQRVRRDAELTLRKAGERAAKILADLETAQKRAEAELRRTETELRSTETELRRVEAELQHAETELRRVGPELKGAEVELHRLQALTDETRTRLSAFTTAALQVLRADVDAEAQAATEATARGSSLDDLRDALRPRPSPPPDAARTAVPGAGSLALYRSQADSNGSAVSEPDAEEQ